MLNLFKKSNEMPEFNIVDDQKRHKRNIVIGFGIFAFVFFNIVMYFLTKV